VAAAVAAPAADRWLFTGLDRRPAGRGFALGGLVQKSGVYTVGEFGPEQVFLPGGSRVASNTSSYNHSRTLAQMVKAAIEEVDRQKGARRNNGF
jgi:SLT domain-containing protein